MKKALMNASVASMIYQFNMSNIDILESLGYQVDVACNFGKENPMNCEEIEKFKKILTNRGIKIIETNCPRSPFAFGKMFHTYRQLKTLADAGSYDLVHTQSPIGGALCRMAFHKARKKGTQVIYTAHGFHFYKGAPLKNWLIYYPIEKICSYVTDVLITINREDYELAQQKMKAEKVVYVPGVGIDLDKFESFQINKKKLREELGVSNEDLLLLSVGELNINKNQEIVIRALREQLKTTLHYAIAGKGELQKQLKYLAKNLGCERNVHFLGFRSDVKELYQVADIFVFPSFREGLSVALMEAMASGLPVVCSRIRGNTDLIDEGIGGELFEPSSPEELEKAIKRLLTKNLKNIGNYNKKKILQFDLQTVMKAMRTIYTFIEKNALSNG